MLTNQSSSLQHLHQPPLLLINTSPWHLIYRHSFPGRASTAGNWIGSMQLNKAPSHFPLGPGAASHTAEGEDDALDEQAISVMAKAWAHPDDYELLKVREAIGCRRASPRKTYDHKGQQGELLGLCTMRLYSTSTLALLVLWWYLQIHRALPLHLCLRWALFMQHNSTVYVMSVCLYVWI